MIMTDVQFTENDVVLSAPDRYETIEIDVVKALESWRVSMFSFELMTNDGKIKADQDIKEEDRMKREDVRRLVRAGKPVPMPVLGIGIHDNVEIGSRRDVFTTLALLGVDKMPVHVRKSQLEDITPYRP